MIDFNSRHKLSFDSSKTKIWFTSDTHFGHENILKYCKRPFENIDEMNRTIRDNWNNRVGKDDIVFHLGDFAFASEGYIKRMLDQLNGKKYLIFGNHDWKRMTKSICENYFEDVSQQMVIRIDGRVIYLNHYPFLAYAGAFRGKDAAWQLFGHVHTSPYCNDGLDIPRLDYLFPYQYDCGVDNNNFSPVSFEEISKHIKENENKIVEKTKK